MAAEDRPQVVCDAPAPGVRVARFVRPDLREHLYDREPIDECSLFRELRARAVDGLARGEAVVLNLGLVDWFPTAFYQLLIRLNREVAAAGGRLLMCCLTPNVREAFALMGGDRTFPGQVYETEARAIAAAKQKPH